FIESTPIARVTSMNGASFGDGSMKVEDGGLLPPGTIELKSGKLELTFFSGARVSIEGPSLFQLKSDFRATLVHVLDGKIEAAPRGGNSFVTLSGNQASRLSRGKLTPIAFLADGWPARPDSQETRGFPGSVHWSFDRFQVDETLDSSGVHPLWLRSSAADRPDASARLQRGMRGQALTFNGVDEYAESTYRGVSGNQARSVALWVRIPPEASHAYPNGIVSWGTYEQSRKWQVCWNNGDQGTVGALRVEFGDGYLIGTTDLRDGLWHHLSVVFLGGDGSDVASHVKLYVNGRLETLSGRKSQFIRTDTESPQAIAVTLGRWLGNWPGKEPFLYHGALDEVFIFEDALTPAQVARLAGDGTP
nr:LamG domain-containing protein [Akkermansiaceae bacterium]